MEKKYTEDSIKSLAPREHVRLKYGMYVGNSSYSNPLLSEILSNAIDEYRIGHGNVIDIAIDTKTNVISVRDYGQGFLPNVMREDGKTVLQASFDTINTSGKFTEDGVYEGTSLGTYGIGAKLATFLSHFLTVTTWRDGNYEKCNFKEGIFDAREGGKNASNEPSGTLVEWQPSEEFFDHAELDMKTLRAQLKKISCVCLGLTINLTIDKKKEVFHSKNGLAELIPAPEILKNHLTITKNDGKNSIDFLLTYTNSFATSIISFVNVGETQSGPHITQVKTIVTREFNKFFKEKKWLKDKDETLSGDDIQEGMCIIFNITTSNVQYDAQIKGRVEKLDMTPFTSLLSEGIRDYLISHEKDIKTIFDKAVAAKKARVAAKNARERIREGAAKKQKALKFASKLADCSAKTRSSCELYITEGDSAAGNLKLARDTKTQAVMPVRGKVLNCSKATLAQISKNAEIMTMLDAFFGAGGWQIDPRTLRVTYKKLRYDKIIIMSDADVDGSHIKNLFYTFIWKLCPDLLTDGHIYAGVPPLYKITFGGNRGYKYLKNDADLEKFRKENPTEKYSVGRMKGLGEMSIEETEETLVHPDSRIIKKITVQNEDEVNQLFEDLMGTSVIPRKEFLQKHSREANELF